MKPMSIDFRVLYYTRPAIEDHVSMSTFLLFGHARLSLGHVLNLCVHSCSIKSPNIIAILKTGKEDSITDMELVYEINVDRFPGFILY
jgi:hypothetical protein